MSPDVERAVRLFLTELATLERDPGRAKRTGFQAELLLQEWSGTAAELLDLDPPADRPPAYLGPH